jgi:serine phosphatase RsbU (regulator of sigma subunit)
MSLRTRLIIAFLVLSVVPLSAVTSIWYLSSVHTFERAAEREANDTARDIGRRMEMVTANLGRRMDRLFDEAIGSGGSATVDGGTVEQRIAPMLGDTAALLERLEFHPSADANPNPNPNPNPDVDVHPDGPRMPRMQRGRRGFGPPPVTGEPGAFRRHPGPPGPPGPPPPPPPGVIVVDVQKAMAEAQRAAAAAGTQAGVDVGAIVAEAMKQSMPAIQAGVQAGIAGVNEAIAREMAAATATATAGAGGKAETSAAPRAPTAPGVRPETAAPAAPLAKRSDVAVSGQKIEVPVWKNGKMVGKANAMLNMDRTIQSVLSLARRDQGEIPFAIDKDGRLYTADPRTRGTLDSLNAAKVASAASGGAPQRVGDWIVVARKDQAGLLFGIARPIGNSLREIRRLSLRNLSVGLLTIVLACIGIVPISRRMTQHVSALSDGVRQLAGGDFKTRVAVQSKDEFGSLAASFNRMAEDLERNQTLIVEQERLRRELELSRQIQTEMLPRAPLRLGAAEIKGLSIPAREVGGDFFNYFALPDGRLAMLVGDVSGKGVSAALLMANVQATLRARLPLETDLARLADGLDRDVDQNTPQSVYVTMFLAILDVERSTLRYVNAGHNPQYLIRERGGIEPLSSTGMPIALYAGHGYQESTVQVTSGDLLFFYTDGLVETENEQGDMFGTERLQALLEAEHAERVDTLLDRIDGAVRSFRGSAEPLDDATTMALRIDA